MPPTDADTPVVAVAGGKGGCGKTTTTLGVALAAARLDRSVLAVDADLDVPDLHRLAGVDGPGERVDDAGRDPPDPGPVPGTSANPPDPRSVPGAAGARVLPARPGTDPRAVAGRLRSPPGDPDVVLVDCPAGAGPDVAHPLRAADAALLVTTAAAQSLRDAAKTAAMARAVGTTVEGAVVTRAEAVPAGAGRLLGTDDLWSVPAARDPLQAPGPRRQYAALARRMAVSRWPQTF